MKHSYERLRNEVMSVQGTDIDPLTLPYLRGTIKEGLRVSMPQPGRLVRIVPQRGWTFKGTYFPAGTHVCCQMFSLHFHPAVWPNPHHFDPGRWDTPTPEQLRDFIPFSSGTRQCIARNLAQAEMAIALRRIVEADLLSGAEPAQEEIVRWDWFNSMVKSGWIELVWR